MVEDSTLHDLFGRSTVKEPKPDDVVFGRGGFANKHPGNRLYIELLKAHEEEYMNCQKKYQKIIALCLVHQMRCKVCFQGRLKLNWVL